MKKLLLLSSFCVLSGCASYASFTPATVEDLTANSWMPVEKAASSCELPAVIEFKKNGELTAEPGCNNMFGKYTLDKSGKVTFSAMGLTRKLCARDYMQQEDHFVAMINKTAYFAKEKGKNELILLGSDKKEVGRLQPEKAGACQ